MSGFALDQAGIDLIDVSKDIHVLRLRMDEALQIRKEANPVRFGAAFVVEVDILDDVAERVGAKSKRMLLEVLDVMRGVFMTALAGQFVVTGLRYMPVAVVLAWAIGPIEEAQFAKAGCGVGRFLVVSERRGLYHGLLGSLRVWLFTDVVHVVTSCMRSLTDGVTFRSVIVI